MVSESKVARANEEFVERQGLLHVMTQAAVKASRDSKAASTAFATMVASKSVGRPPGNTSPIGHFIQRVLRLRQGANEDNGQSQGRRSQHLWDLQSYATTGLLDEWRCPISGSVGRCRTWYLDFKFRSYLSNKWFVLFGNSAMPANQVGA
jgi:hypothetical protein